MVQPFLYFFFFFPFFFFFGLQHDLNRIRGGYVNSEDSEELVFLGGMGGENLSPGAWDENVFFTQQGEVGRNTSSPKGSCEENAGTTRPTEE